MQKQFWHDAVTEKSFIFLQGLRKNFKFVLIGGWAVYFHTKALKSKDIDIVVGFEELAKLRQSFPLIKNDRLSKYEIKAEGFDVDIYVPPVIPYAYDYLFTWKAILYHKSPLTENVNLLYTLYEEDIPTRLDPWIVRQDKVGKVSEEVVFRGITVQRRDRL